MRAIVQERAHDQSYCTPLNCILCGIDLTHAPCSEHSVFRVSFSDERSALQIRMGRSCCEEVPDVPRCLFSGRSRRRQADVRPGSHLRGRGEGMGAYRERRSLGIHFRVSSAYLVPFSMWYVSRCAYLRIVPQTRCPRV